MNQLVHRIKSNPIQSKDHHQHHHQHHHQEIKNVKISSKIKSNQQNKKNKKKFDQIISRFKFSTLFYIFRYFALFSLLIYFIALKIKDWPPSSNNQIDSFDRYQGEWWVSHNLTRSQRILVVVAHPDDECLFFSPTLLNILLPRFINQSFHSSINHSSISSINQTFLPSSFNQSPISLNNQTFSSQPTLLPFQSINSSSPFNFRPQGHILSLSSGNAQGLGLKRTREMRASCWAFGIPSTRCIVIDHPELPDSMSVWWPESKIAELVKLYIDLWEIDAVITFDHDGISGHINHRAIAAALSRLVHTDPKFPITFMLRTTMLLEKYSSLLSLPYSLYRHHRYRKSFLPQFPRPISHPSQDKGRLEALVLRTLLYLNATIDSFFLLNKTSPFPSVNDTRSIPQDVALNSSSNSSSQHRLTDSKLSTHSSLFLSSPLQYYEGRRAFNQHVSQNVWFRRLWLIFSRYMWINELVRVVPIEDRFQDADQFNKEQESQKLINYVLEPQTFSSNQPRLDKRSSRRSKSSKEH
ncbi:hypothetical protein O181_002578 [Austropuccinia psidii MF-1]|uniref:N-acetylglucosaminylphosphatidylinositol deacetylase n=1 Tax=Austropuccinia psidii MF-1 TaxID=1389203 RepID=A0A9Q3GCR8_9BASI|nr:hypothetical protein [Austropuccinia psidii MF-1]